MALSSRAAAAKVLDSVLFKGQSLTDALATVPQHLSSADQALVQELCFGVCRFGHRLQGLIDPLLRRPLKNKEKVVHGLLLLGAYQLLYTRIPDHAAISATVDVTRELQKAWATGLVNGILRRIQRDAEALSLALDQQIDSRYAHPTWLLQLLMEAWPTAWQAIAAANNAQAPMWLRVNLRQGSRAAYLQELAQAGIAAEAGAHNAESVRLAEPCAVTVLPGFASGRVSVQDEAAQLAASLLQLAPGQRVLDACAAPGGKTCHMLEACAQLAEVVAVDQVATRLARVEENLTRLGLSATVVCADAAQPSGWWDGQAFDRILLDAPCSATGVIRRHPDIKWLRREGDIDKLVALQQTLLQALWPALKPGGVMVYATCSVLPAENEQTLAQFLAQTPDATHLPIAASWGTPKLLGRQCLPQTQGHDGFYYACLQKSAAAQ